MLTEEEEGDGRQDDAVKERGKQVAGGPLRR